LRPCAGEGIGADAPGETRLCGSQARPAEDQRARATDRSPSPALHRGGERRPDARGTCGDAVGAAAIFYASIDQPFTDPTGQPMAFGSPAHDAGPPGLSGKPPGAQYRACVALVAGYASAVGG